MNTGICKGLLLGLTAFALSACSNGLSFGEGGFATRSKLPPPLTLARMAQGTVTLVPPSGYCIDPTSLTQQFALMARCDVLGATSATPDAPLGLLTVSVAQNDGTALSAAVVAIASNSKVTETLNEDGFDIVQAATETPPAGLSQNHLRATARIDGYDLSMALFSPPDSAAQGPRGKRMLQNLVLSSQDATIAKAVAAKATTNATKQKKGPVSLIAGLFD